MKKASPAVCNTCGAGVCLHVSRAEDGYLSRIRELESRANAREVEVRAHMEARFAAEAECARLHQALDAAHAEASDCGNSENDEACGECRECWHVTKESMCRRISRAEMARDARTQDVAALRAENERLALSLVDAEDRLAAALDDRAFLLELLGITVKTGTKDPLLDARLAEARAFLAGGKP